MPKATDPERASLIERLMTEAGSYVRHPPAPPAPPPPPPREEQVFEAWNEGVKTKLVQDPAPPAPPRPPPIPMKEWLSSRRYVQKCLWNLSEPELKALTTTDVVRLWKEAIAGLRARAAKAAGAIPRKGKA